MQRKLVQHGESTLMVSLPAKWIKKQGLKKGDEISILENDNDIMISTRKKNILESITIEIKDKTKKDLRTYIGSLYKKGYDEIRIRFNDESQILKVEQAISTLHALEVIEQNNKYCIIKNIGDDSQDIIEVIIKKIFFITKNICDTIKIEKNGKYKNIDFVKSIQKKQYWYRDYCLRLISKNIEGKEAFALYTFVFELDKLGAMFRKLYCYLYKYSIKFDKKNEDDFNKIYMYFMTAFDRYLKKSSETKIFMELRGVDFEDKIMKTQEKSKNTMLYTYFHNISTLISGMNGLLYQIK